METRNTTVLLMRYIFGRPLLASLFVGSCIHLLFYINQFVATGKSHFMILWTMTENHVVSGLGQFLIPFLVPFMVTRIGAVLSSIKQLELRQDIGQTTQTFERLASYLDDTFSEYDPLTFNLDDHYGKIVEALMRVTDQPTFTPSHLFLAGREGGKLTGHIYFREKNKICKIEDEVVINLISDTYSIVSEKSEVLCSNWEDEGVSLAEYQRRFHPQVRQQVGTIERFVTYQSGSVAIIGFYQGRPVGESDAQVLKGFTVFSNSLKRISEESKQTRQAFNYTMDALARASEANDEDTGDHIARINEYAKVLAVEMGCDAEFVETIHRSAQMHDVGKIHISAAILKKPGKLSEDEFKKMKTHPYHGAKILGDSPYLAMAAEIALNHHEKYNGKGYPRGLQGTDIPLSARIVALSDVYDALRQARVYKPAFSHEKSVQVITEGDGRTVPDEFDPAVLNAFVKTADQFDEIFERFQTS
jgi:HD-GYP domain-containing protein (c-di-GMP phosphodiesterase class II)